MTPGSIIEFSAVDDNLPMDSLYRRPRCPPEIISHAVWLYHRFALSLRDVEDLFADRGVSVSYEAICGLCRTLGPAYARALPRRPGRFGDRWPGDEVFITVRGERRYLRREAGQHGDILDILLARRRDARAAKRFLRMILKRQGSPPSQPVTDKLRSYAAARCGVGLSANNRTGQYENSRAEIPHQHTRERERRTSRFKSAAQVERFLSVHGAIQILF